MDVRAMLLNLLGGGIRRRIDDTLTPYGLAFGWSPEQCHRVGSAIRARSACTPFAWERVWSITQQWAGPHAHEAATVLAILHDDARWTPYCAGWDVTAVMQAE